MAEAPGEIGDSRPAAVSAGGHPFGSGHPLELVQGDARGVIEQPEGRIHAGLEGGGVRLTERGGAVTDLDVVREGAVGMKAMSDAAAAPPDEGLGGRGV